MIQITNMDDTVRVEQKGDDEVSVILGRDFTVAPGRMSCLHTRLSVKCGAYDEVFLHRDFDFSGCILKPVRVLGQKTDIQFQAINYTDQPKTLRAGTQIARLYKCYRYDRRTNEAFQNRARPGALYQDDALLLYGKREGLAVDDVRTSQDPLAAPGAGVKYEFTLKQG